MKLMRRYPQHVFLRLLVVAIRQRKRRRNLHRDQGHPQIDGGQLGIAVDWARRWPGGDTAEASGRG